ncbi:hypothetical protein F4780DRAFT_755584 [Xylariomycetidae sp. FL0641]|nr:hypothetical protein F4780DRAFT_755584 [Xylariomycetidae sp. FL0641]
MYVPAALVRSPEKSVADAAGDGAPPSESSENAAPTQSRPTDSTEPVTDKKHGGGMRRHEPSAAAAAADAKPASVGEQLVIEECGGSRRGHDHLLQRAVCRSSRANVSTGWVPAALPSSGGFVVMFRVYRYRYALWARCNFLLAAAFDAGFSTSTCCPSSWASAPPASSPCPTGGATTPAASRSATPSIQTGCGLVRYIW